jgi:tetratricopeptide (TPR) repeat protein
MDREGTWITHLTHTTSGDGRHSAAAPVSWSDRRTAGVDTMTGVDERTAIAALELAEEVAPGLTGQEASESLARLEERSAELLEALDWFVDGGRDDEALRLANSLYRFWITQRQFKEGAHWFDRVLASGRGDAGLRGRAYLGAGFMPFWMGDDAGAAALFEQALAIGREIDDAALVSQALGGLSRVALRTDVEQGRRLARQALDVSDTAGDENGRSNALHLLGVGAQIAGDLPEARDWMTQRLALVRGQGNDFLVASEAGNLSMVERQLGDLDAAEVLARESLVTSERIEDRFTPPFMFSGLAAIALERGDPERAATLIGAAESQMEATQMAWPPDERPHYERTVAGLEARMSPADLARARSVGAALSSAGAIDYALERDASPSREGV